MIAPTKFGIPIFILNLFYWDDVITGILKIICNSLALRIGFFVFVFVLLHSFDSVP